MISSKLRVEILGRHVDGRVAIARLRGRRPMGIRVVVAMAFLTCLVPTANAWLYPEHRDISLLAVQELDPEHKALFATLWEDARAGDGERLCVQGAAGDQGLTPSCIDWAALSAIAGDHSCSSEEMLETARASDWVLRVAAVGARLKADLAAIPIVSAPTDEKTDYKTRMKIATNRAARSNIVRTSDVRLQQVDHALATRASNNAAHFPLARPSTSLDASAYAQLTVNIGSEMNAVGAYVWFHLSALQKAGRLAKEQLTGEQRRALARAAMFDEAFALHFLEDMFASGHVAGSWGDLSQRKGTHDFYNENGLEVFTWQRTDTTIVLMGDAQMRPEDSKIAADTVRMSIEELLDTAAGRSRGYEIPYTPAAAATPDGFDVCTSKTIPQRDEGVRYDVGYRQAMAEVLLSTPVPGLGQGFGSVPRFRSEIGTFFGFAGSIDARQIDGGFLPSQTESGLIGGLDVSFRAGFGLEGAVGDQSDGLVYGAIGMRSNSNSSNKASDAGVLGGTLGSAIPPRSGLSLRFRMPFWVVPGDLLFASPLYLINRDKYTQMATTATNGGLIPWQLGHASRHGRWQVMIGRELGITLYGRHRVDQLWVPAGGTLGEVLNYESTAYDLPIFEFRPYRSFSSNQTSSVMLQFFVGADVPHKVTVAYPAGTAAPNLETVWSLGVRAIFDWRHYR